jgi:hypothetical protein
MPVTASSARISPRRVALVFGAAALVGGLALVTGGVSTVSTEWTLARRGAVVEGTVIEKRIDHVTRRKTFWRGADSRSYVVRYAFVTRRGEGADGEQAVGEALWRSLPQSGPVAVRYLEAIPSTNRLDAAPRDRSGAYPLTGGVLVAGGLAALAVALRKRRKGA